MAVNNRVIWTQEAKRQVDGIIGFLRQRWSEREVSDFLDLLDHFEKTISAFPETFKESKKFKGCRLGLVHRHVTAVYKVSKQSVVILTVLDNRQDIAK